MKNKELNNILDDITAGIRADEADDAQVSDAAKRVWAQLSVDKNALTMSANRWQGDSGSADSIAGCPDFQALIPTYLRGELLEARSLLLLDHTHECIACRKALQRGRPGNRFGIDRAAFDSAIRALRIIRRDGPGGRRPALCCHECPNTTSLNRCEAS